MVSPFLFNTEQYSLYSCNMISRVEVRNITDKLLGVKISLLRMASGGFFKQKYFSKVFKFIVSSNFNVRIRIKAMKLFYFTTVVYCSLNSTMQGAVVLKLGWASESPGGLDKQPTAPSKSVGLGWGPRICISSKSPGDATTTGPTPHLLSYCIKEARPTYSEAGTAGPGL